MDWTQVIKLGAGVSAFVHWAISGGAKLSILKTLGRNVLCVVGAQRSLAVCWRCSHSSICISIASEQMLHSYKPTLWALLWKQCGTYESFLDPWNVLQEASGRACSDRMGAERTVQSCDCPILPQRRGRSTAVWSSLSGLSVLITITGAKQRIQRRHRTQGSRTQRLWSWPLFTKTNSKVKSQLRQGKLCFLPTSQLESTFTEKEKKQMPESDTSQENKNGKKVALECDWESH